MPKKKASVGKTCPKTGAKFSVKSGESTQRFTIKKRGLSQAEAKKEAAKLRETHKQARMKKVDGCGYVVGVRGGKKPKSKKK